MACRIPHGLPEELDALARRAEFHALAMPREARGEIDDALLECHRLPGLRLLRIYVPSPQLRGDAPLPLLLVNDGHKAFEARGRNGFAPAHQQTGTLQLHRVMDGMLCVGEVRPAVVVAIANHAASRADQFVPVRTQLGETEFGGFGDSYLDLLQHEVLPAVHARLHGVNLSHAPADRILLGSSLGGFAAIYGAMVRPQVFGGAVALSPSAWVDDGYLDRLAGTMPDLPARIAADIGAAERPPIREHCGRLFATLRARGNGQVSAEEVDGVHNEDSWRERLPRLLRHVLGTVGDVADGVASSQAG